MLGIIFIFTLIFLLIVILSITIIQAYKLGKLKEKSIRYGNITTTCKHYMIINMASGESYNIPLNIFNKQINQDTIVYGNHTLKTKYIESYTYNKIYSKSKACYDNHSFDVSIHEKTENTIDLLDSPGLNWKNCYEIDKNRITIKHIYKEEL